MLATPAYALGGNAHCGTGLQSKLTTAVDGTVIHVTDASCPGNSYGLPTTARVEIRGAPTTFHGAAAGPAVFYGITSPGITFRNIRIDQLGPNERGISVDTSGIVQVID